MNNNSYNNSNDKDRMSNESYENDINTYADAMLNRFVIMFQDLVREVPKIKSAIVENVNSDGTVNVKLPSDTENVYTRIQNQSIWQNLVPGDEVELLLKDGTFSNCWIIAKHNKMN